jgi:demethylmenaquinone methyltransferase/2-methoxy-6-polyprenyl-1,4-benzoquinol methylase
MSSVLPPPQDKAAAVEAMFDRIAARYDRLNRVMTFRLDVGWRRTTVRALELAPNSVVADLACGTGDFCRELQRRGMRPIGFDFSAGMLTHAATDAPLVRADVLTLPLRDASVDAITCGFALRNLTALDPFIAECTRVVRPGGRIALLEVAEPRRAPVRKLHHLYFHRVVPWIGARLSDPTAYAYLPASTSYLPPPEEMLAMMRRHGFTDVQRRVFLFGAAQLLVGTRP